MKTTRCLKWTVLALALANGFTAAAQSNRVSGGPRVPGPTAYAQFSAFITERNIFDPSRFARYTPTGQYRPPTRRNVSAPTFTLVGTMSYEKGMFAFFDGNQPYLRKVLYQSDSNSIAGYTVTEITLTGVTLQTADKKETVQMKIGEMMRQEGNHWLPAGKGELSAGASGAENSSPDTNSAPSSAGEPNDILKKLMQQREQELK